ncbi:MAG: prenyltransferase/squalene oxidase repeat-containing protein, partial [Planctomycetota bacterium]
SLTLPEDQNLHGIAPNGNAVKTPDGDLSNLQILRNLSRPAGTTMSKVSPERIAAGYARVRDLLLSQRVAEGHWVGELSTSALSTATAVMALEQVRRAQPSLTAIPALPQFDGLIAGGLQWLVEHQNADGGWGDTTASFSNISTTMLCHAVFHATGVVEKYSTVVANAKLYVDRAGGVPALRRRYGRDKTFSIPILTHCALAGLVDWREISSLPFELACIPHQFYKWVRLPVVSYALPALIAIGQCRFHHRPTRNPLLRVIRNASISPSLRLLEKIQPTSGGFLEAAPLTSFVTMSLASIGQAEHPVVQQGIRFLIDSVRPDGSWPIDTNLATWVTTLSINALGPDLPADSHEVLREFLWNQQYRTVHPYTQAEPGGWAWTDLTGGVPDADDTPGALLAITTLMGRETSTSADSPAAYQNEVLWRAELGIQDDRKRLSAATRQPGQEGWSESLQNGIRWLLDLQNSDGGWPTFCRGWGALPFDRSAADLTAHALRAITAWRPRGAANGVEAALLSRSEKAVAAGVRYLAKTQRADGSWLPLWFGNQYHPDDENATYGTARVLAAYRDTQRKNAPEYQRGLKWLLENQNDDGSWSGSKGLPPSVEETSLALEIIVSANPDSHAAHQGLDWLLKRIEDGTVHQQSPIGFYFAKLWYSEKLYPLCFATQALRRAVSMSLDGAL